MLKKSVKKTMAVLLAGVLLAGCGGQPAFLPEEDHPVPTGTPASAAERWEKISWLDDEAIYLAGRENENANDSSLVVARYTLEDGRFNVVLQEPWPDVDLRCFEGSRIGDDKVVFTGDTFLIFSADDTFDEKIELDEYYINMTDYNSQKQQLAFVEQTSLDLCVFCMEEQTIQVVFDATTTDEDAENSCIPYYPKQSPNGDKIACIVSPGDLAMYNSLVCVITEGEELFTISPIDKPEGSSIIDPYLAWWNGNLVLIQTNEIENEWYGTVQVFDGNDGQLLDSFRFDGNLVCMGNGICSDGKIPFVSFDVEEWRYDVGVVNLNEKMIQVCYAQVPKNQEDWKIVSDVAISPAGEKLALIEDNDLIIVPCEKAIK